MKPLTDPLALVSAGRYTDAGNAGDLLPDVYGDFTAGGLHGPIPTVLVNKTANVYASAAHAVQAIDKVYVDDVEQLSGFTVNVSNDYQSQGVIATITFSTAPTGLVTWRGKGKLVGGVLDENPVIQLEDLLKTRAAAMDADFDATTLALAKSRATAQAYKTAWVVQDTAAIAQWITEIMFNATGSWRVTGIGRLALSVDTGLAPDAGEVVAHVVSERDCVDGGDGVRFSVDALNVVTAMTVEYQWMYADGVPGARDATPEDTVAKSSIGELRWTVQLRGLRRSQDVSAWATVIFARQSYKTRVEGARVEFTVAGPRCLHVTMGDAIGFSWGRGPTREESNAYRNELLRVMEASHSYDRGGESRLVAMDTGNFLVQDAFFDAGVPPDDTADKFFFDADVWFGKGRELAVMP